MKALLPAWLFPTSNLIKEWKTKWKINRIEF